jgi:hypothetical protein
MEYAGGQTSLPGNTMKALFADLSERVRQSNRDTNAHKAHARRQLRALFDAVQIAVATGQHDRVDTLLKEMHAIVHPALARRRGTALMPRTRPTQNCFRTSASR